ncbi:LLM class flavin-dependent oxidoreductase [Mesobacillus foraminis]|uniref:LLM class flavin-dependent oxidoreductase n=1 Tax=Mesobacillus foraminis TaxID=279826 RepID=UPI000EF4E4CE|nr:LLM class flavin-dependent oxidoreductase [Mesobacillus foraminis]
MRLSILDQAPISAGQSSREALSESVKLAQAGDALGYSRYWIAEHHDLEGLASSAPEVMLGIIGAHTKNIRLGPGAVLLPHYKPYKVAEIYNTLATLFPGRIDIGIGRAPGGSAEAANALSDHFLQKVWNMPNAVKDLLHFLERNFPEEHEHAKLKASPVPEIPPVPWLLGTSKKSALLAGENGLPYVFGKFMSDSDGQDIISEYLGSFKPRKPGQTPEVILTVSAVCAESDDRAQEIALSSLVWTLQRGKGEGQQGVPAIYDAKNYPVTKADAEALKKMKQKMIIGNPGRVKEKLIELKDLYKADEIMLVTITHSPEDKVRSYQLIADELLNS